MASKKRVLGWLVAIFVGLPILVGVFGSILSSNELDSAKSRVNCEMASPEDVETLGGGMSENTYTLGKAFQASLTEDEISELRSIFPSYTNPTIIAAEIVGVGEDSLSGLWAIQKVTDSGSLRVTALNADARKYSLWGQASADGSAAAQLRDKLLKFGNNTNALSCLES